MIKIHEPFLKVPRNSISKFTARKKESLLIGYKTVH